MNMYHLFPCNIKLSIGTLLFIICLFVCLFVCLLQIIMNSISAYPFDHTVLKEHYNAL